MPMYWYEERWDFYSKKPDPWQKFFAEMGKCLLFVVGVSILCAALFGGCTSNVPRDTQPPAQTTQTTPAKHGRD